VISSAEFLIYLLIGDSSMLVMIFWLPLLVKPDMLLHFFFRGSHDGDFCVVDVKEMEISHWSKKLHLGSPVYGIEFCPTER
jgi:hypothetical protein